MQEDRTPKVFISYSWSSDTITIPLAERLVAHGVDVVLDKWDLKEGQDKFKFMEQCVNDPDITKVLIICDRKYAVKANSRSGGVGDETVIISGEVYGNVKQEKFIPIIAECDDEGNPYVPTYIKSRIYIDFTNEEKYESEYEKLLRNIYDKPLFRKPKLGNRPEWIDEEKTNIYPLVDLLHQIKGGSSAKKQQSCISRFVEEYINILKTFYMQGGIDAKQVFDCFVEMKQVRDVFLDFIAIISETELPFSDIICGAFEKMYNTLTNAKGFDPEACSANDSNFEIYHIHIWELFICLIAFLRNRQKYSDIHSILTNTYFLLDSHLSDTVNQANYCGFRFHSRIIEDVYKPTTEQKNLFTLLGNTICLEREKLPVYSREAIAEADVFLYQVRGALTLTERKPHWRDSYWFPTCYVYAKSQPEEWRRMASARYCKRMFELFGVGSIEELKDVLKECFTEREMRYGGSFDSVPGILGCIKLEEIGSVN